MASTLMAKMGATTIKTEFGYVHRIRARVAARKLARFHQDCDRLCIPHNVRDRMWRGGMRRVDWYAGRQTRR